MSVLTSQAILDKLAKHNAVITNHHFVYTSGRHGTGYANMRAVSHLSGFMADLGLTLAARLADYSVDVVIGPETLGRTLAGYTAAFLGDGHTGIWCDVKQTSQAGKWAEFSPKLDFGRSIGHGTRVAIVDDLLTTGGSIKLTADLVESLEGEVVVAAVVVRRSPEVTAADCGASALEVLAEVSDFSTYTADECAAHGPCSQRVPMAYRPGHGHEWLSRPENKGYPMAGSHG